MNGKPIIELEKVCKEADYDCEYDEIYYKVFMDGAWLMNLEMTCGACPEQYELRSLLDMKELAYMRLRWSHFRCDYEGCGGETIYSTQIDDTGWSGQFDSEEQRIEHLTNAIRKVIERIRREDEDDD